MNKEFLKLLRCIGWDIQFVLKYNIITVAIIITVLYTLIFKLIPGANIPEVVVSLIFSDPTMLGFIFIGAMVLFEKDANTLQALTVTPIKPWQYIWSKAITLTLIALFCSMGMAIAANGFKFNIILLTIGVFLSSLLFTFIGLIGVSKIKTINEYIILIPMFILPAIIPLADLYNLMHSPFIYLIPTQASLILLRGAFEKISWTEILYSVSMLCISVWITYLLAKKHYIKFIIGKSKVTI